MEHHFQSDKGSGVSKWQTARSRGWNIIANVNHASHLLRAPLASSNSYPYRPLDSSRNEIRLIRKSEPFKVNGRVSYTLTHVSLDEKPQYEALSYTWADDSGNADFQRTIIVDGYVVSVTKNLEAALSQFFTDEDERTLWVDALCINQMDTLERNEQVGKMKFIYHEAIGVVTWLGREHNESRNAFKLLRSFLENGIKKTVYNGVEPADSRKAAPDCVVEDIYAVIKLFKRQYWERSWVIQEVGLAKRVVLHCGSDSMAWEDMNSILKALHQEGILMTDAFESTAVGHLAWHLFNAGPNQIARRDDVHGEDITALHQALVRHRLKKATDSRDKIYSLLGMLSPDIQARIPIDYSLEPRILFQNVATFIVVEERSLSLLAENKASDDYKILPSWVPNWSNANSADKIRVDRIDVPHNTFNASGTGSNADAHVLLNHVLRVKGIRLGTITAAGHEMPDVVDEDPNVVPVFDTLYEWWLLFCSTGRRDIVGRQSFVDIINFGSFYRPLSHLAPEEIKEAENTILEVIKIARSIYKPWDKTLIPILEDLEKPVTESEKRNAEMNIWNISPYCQKRRFIIVDGKKCGVGPQGVKVGDHIVALLGCRVPLILRERRENDDDGYLNVGDAFLQGYMGGEAVKDVEDGIRKFESFELH